jgi:hypothetical protein
VPATYLVRHGYVLVTPLLDTWQWPCPATILTSTKGLIANATIVSIDEGVLRYRPENGRRDLEPNSFFCRNVRGYQTRGNIYVYNEQAGDFQPVFQHYIYNRETRTFTRLQPNISNQYTNAERKGCFVELQGGQPVPALFAVYPNLDIGISLRLDGPESIPAEDLPVICMGATAYVYDRDSGLYSKYPSQRFLHEKNRLIELAKGIGATFLRGVVDGFVYEIGYQYGKSLAKP